MKLLLKILTIFVALSNIFFVLGVVEVVCACLNRRIGRKVISLFIPF